MSKSAITRVRVSKVLLLYGILIGLGVGSCDSSERGNDFENRTRRDNTRMFLNMFRVEVESVWIEQQHRSAAEIPNTIPAILKWMRATWDRRDFPPAWAYQDPKENRLSDAWWHEIIVISKNGKPVGFGSCGENGIWENGEGDDIYEPIQLGQD